MRALFPFSGPLARGVATVVAALLTRTRLVPTLDVEALFSAAGVDPATDPDALEPLAAMIDSARGELGLGIRGQVLLGQRFTGILETRSRLRRRRDLTGQVASDPEAPILVVTGFPRTGTTLTHRLLAAAPDAIAPRWYELMEPSLEPEADVDAERKRRCNRWRRALTAVDLLSPGLRRVHEIIFNGPEECTHLHEAAFDTESFALAGPCSDYQDWLNDRTPARRRLRYTWQATCLEAILRDRPEQDRSGRWVLKAPQHLLQMDDLFATFPQARIVRMHRDPIDAMTSAASLVRHAAKIVGGVLDSSRAEEVVDVFEEWQDRGDEGMRSHPDFVLEIHYDDLVTDPVSVVERIHDFAGLALTGAHVDRIRTHLHQRPRHHFGRHRYRTGDFGIDAAATRERLASYIDRIAELRTSTPEVVGLG